MPKLMYRVGGLEKDLETGHISYDPANHQRMTEMRSAKIAAVAEFIPKQDFELGPDSGKLVVVGWGSTHGPVYQAAKKTGVSFIHLRHINPLPKNLGGLLDRFEQILVPEMNTGQLSSLLRDKLGIAPVSYSKVTGQPFRIAELVDQIQALLKGASS
jgi:2-oxoglutarate ferredoxin oxidoreductase subunit alpha